MRDDDARRWIAAGIRHHQAGELDEAERLYKRVLRWDATHPDALHFLGVLAYQRGDAAAGVESIRSALRSQPEYPDAYNNLGRILSETGRHDEAIDAFRAALQQNPELVDARYNLGVCLRKQGAAEEAAAEIEQAIGRGFSSAQAYYQLGLAYCDAGQAEPTCAALQKALELDPQLTRAYERLGVVLYALGRIDDAADVYARWLEIEPASAKARHLKSACAGVDVPERAADEYITEVFDAFASTFDEKLARLDYRAPALIAEAVDALDLPAGEADVLDAGCGTGLCGPLIARYARRLVGVDLSSGMVAKAEELGVYDELEVGELVALMAARPGQFDLIVSADTLVYFGRLDAAMTAAARALRSGGALVFTVEALSEGAAPFVLKPHGRYAHSRGYVEAQIRDSGLTLLRIEPVVLRHENRRPVDGLLAVARR
jgi:predicted TPR repeat methyltransferase